MQRREYISPSLDELMTRASALKTDYLERKGLIGHENDANPLRLQQIKDLMMLHDAVDKLRKAAHRPDQETEAYLTRVCLGAWIQLLESIEQSYIGRHANPISPMGYHLHGSELYHLVCDGLNINTENTIEPESRFIFLNLLHQFSAAREALDPGYEGKIISSMQSVRHTMENMLYAWMHAVPARDHLITEMSDMYHLYCEDKQKAYSFTRMNEDRPYCAQLAQVLAAVINDKIPLAKNSIELERSDRVLIGMLIYIMKTAQSGRLYNRCKDILNGTPESIKPEDQFSCLAALKTYLHDNDNVQLLSDTAEHIFKDKNKLRKLDAGLELISHRIEKELTLLDINSGFSFTGAKIAAVAGAIAVYPVGLGVGSLLGKVASGTAVRANDNVREFVTGVINTYSYYFTQSRSVGYVAATPVITAVYQAALGNMLGITVAATTGLLTGAVGYFIFDLATRSAIHYLRSGGHYRDPAFSKHIKAELIEQIKQAPVSVISANERLKLLEVIGKNESGKCNQRFFSERHHDVMPETDLINASHAITHTRHSS